MKRQISISGHVLARLRCAAVAVGAGFLIIAQSGPCHATTKGLNQIVTADIQPVGQLSISYQMQDPNIGNREELQAELGITKQFEIAAFQGFSPSDQILNAEYGIVQNPQWLLSTGFLSWTTKGDQPQPFLVGAHISGQCTLTLGAVSVPIPGAPRTTEALVGYAYKADARTQYQVDYQSGSGNSATAGVTYSITPSLTFNPALYVSNDTGHKLYGYSVLSYTITVFK